MTMSFMKPKSRTFRIYAERNVADPMFQVSAHELLGENLRDSTESVMWGSFNEIRQFIDECEKEQQKVHASITYK
jgi:hypothetical protein